MTDSLVDKRLDEATGVSPEQQDAAWNNNSAVILPDDGVTEDGIAKTALEQAGKTQKVEPITQESRPSSLPLPE